MSSRPVLALDFDGVICDSTEECVVTAWNAWRNTMVLSSSDVPEPYRSALQTYRNYVRTAGEYRVVLEAADRGEPIQSQAEYDDLVANCAEPLAGFGEVFFNARERLRSKSEALWLDLHKIYKGIPEGLRELWPSFSIFVVTGKDRESVKLFFNRMELPLPDDHIYDKDAALNKLEAVRGINADVFIDDNIHHLRPIHQAGVGALMAGWGYHTDEHLQIASKLGIRIITLDDWVSVVTQYD